MKNIKYKEFEIINFTHVSAEEKKLILKWRNHEDVRKWMINKNIISNAEHNAYMSSLADNHKKMCFIIKDETNYLGVVEFDEINLDNGTAYFGLNSNPDNNRMGIGKILEEISVYLSKQHIGLKKLMLYVYIDNQRAINLYEKSGFKIIKEQSIRGGNAYFMEKTI